jgi:hypothetical protein
MQATLFQQYANKNLSLPVFELVFGMERLIFVILRIGGVSIPKVTADKKIDRLYKDRFNRNFLGEKTINLIRK